MVPFADLLQHRGKAQTTYRYDDALKAVVVEATEDIEDGETIYCSNEAISNSVLFVDRGYVAEDNKDLDVIGLTFALDENDT